MPEWIKDHPQYEVISAALRSESRHEKRWAAKVLEQFESQQTQYAGEHDDLCWYFLTFCCGFGYGYCKQQTLSGRLTPKLVAKQLGMTEKPPQHKSLHVSMPNQTMAACIDIDVKSLYHPANNGEGLKPVKEALAEIGLIEALEFQSSHSTGVHLWYPLPTANNSWELAVAMEDASRAKNLEIKSGTLELRPNKRNFDRNYLTIRLPLSGDGNALRIGGVVGLEESSVAILRHFFNRAAKHNRLTPLQREQAIVACSSSNTRAPVGDNKSLNYYKSVLSDGFSSSSQTQQIQFAALIVARMVEGVDSLSALRDRVSELVSSAPGFQQHCNHQEQILNGSYWSNSTLFATLQFSESDYNKSWRKVYNDKKAQTASKQALQAIRRAIDDGEVYCSQNIALEALRANYEAPCRRWWLKPDNAKYKKYVGSAHQKEQEVNNRVGFDLP